MKVELAEPIQPFHPLIITLESQTEMNELFAVLNSSVIYNVTPTTEELHQRLNKYETNTDEERETIKQFVESKTRTVE